jgi:hypothetical protein
MGRRANSHRASEAIPKNPLVATGDPSQARQSVSPITVEGCLSVGVDAGVEEAVDGLGDDLGNDDAGIAPRGKAPSSAAPIAGNANAHTIITDSPT